MFDSVCPSAFLEHFIDSNRKEISCIGRFSLEVVALTLVCKSRRPKQRMCMCSYLLIVFGRSETYLVLISVTQDSLSNIDVTSDLCCHGALAIVRPTEG